MKNGKGSRLFSARRVFILALFVILMCAACRGKLRQVSPVPQVFGSPPADFTAYSRIPFEEKDHFGAAVSLEGDTLAIGAPVWGYPGEGAGSAYVYRRSAKGIGSLPPH